MLHPTRLVTVTDAALAARLADHAGAVLLDVRATWAGTASELRAAGDRAAQDVLAAALTTERPGDHVLSEEAPDDPSRLGAQRVWIVDPLDGTREFAGGRHDWAVHVALWEAGELVAGAVALPERRTTLRTDRPTAAGPRPDGPLRLAVSRTRAPEEALRVADAVGAELVPMGSAGCKVAAVVLGEADAYVHAGGQYEWDSAAPVAVARAAGLHTSRLDGTPLRYNRPDPFLPDLVVARPEFAEAILAAGALGARDAHLATRSP